MIELLRGVRVVESAILLTGDHLGTLLGDLGADVIKIERPPAGDYLRDFLGQIGPHRSPAHLQVNKNKRSVLLDLREPDGLRAFWSILDTADVFIDGSAGDAADRLGIGYAAQRERRPGIVYCQISGYGARGPYASIPTHGQMMNALAAGIPQVVGEDGLCHRDGRAATDFRLTGLNSEATAAAGVWGAFLVAAALHRRAVSGEGCHIDLAATDAVLATGWIGAVYGANWERMTETASLPSFEDQAKYQFYETRDGRVVLFCGIEPKFWRNFCRAAGCPELLDGGASGAPETAGRTGAAAGPVDFAADAALRSRLAEVFRGRTQAEWVALAVEHDIPLGPAHNDVPEVMTDPHVAQRGIFHTAEHPGAGEFTYVGQPGIVAGQPYGVHRPAPDLGQHTREVLREVGWADAELDELSRAGVIGR